MLTPKISKKLLKRMGNGEWQAIKHVAHNFGVKPKEIITEINELGALINGVLLTRMGQVYIMPLEGVDEEEVGVGFIRNTDDLINIGLQAYYSWRDESQYALRLYDGKKDWRWYPKRCIHSLDEVIS